MAVVVINLERKSTAYRAMERSTLGEFYSNLIVLILSFLLWVVKRLRRRCM